MINFHTMLFSEPSSALQTVTIGSDTFKVNPDQCYTFSDYFTTYADSLGGHASSYYIPYINADQDVDLGEQRLTTLGLGSFGNYTVTSPGLIAYTAGSSALIGLADSGIALEAASDTGIAGSFLRYSDGDVAYPVVYVNQNGDTDPSPTMILRNEGLGYNLLIQDKYSKRFSITKTGIIDWWSAPYGTPDTNLYRSSSNTLKTDGNFIASQITASSLTFTTANLILNCTSEYSLNSGLLDGLDNNYFAVKVDVYNSTTSLRTDLTTETTTRIYADNLLGQATGYISEYYLLNSSASATYVYRAGDTMTGDLDITGSLTVTEEIFASTVCVTERVLVDKVWHVYGGTQAADTTINLTKDVWAKVTNAAEDLWQGTEFDGFTLITDSMVFLNAGDYSGTLVVGVSALANTKLRFRLYNVTDSAQEGNWMSFTGLGANNIVPVPIPLYFEGITANDVFILQVLNVSNSNDVTIEDAIFYIVYLHD